MARFTPPFGRVAIQELEIQIDGDQLVRIDDRPHATDEIEAESAVDDIFEAFNTQDLDALTALFGDDVMYTSPSDVEFVGPQITEHGHDAFGETAVRTTGVFDLGDGTHGFDFYFIEPDSGRANKVTATIEFAGGRITSWVESRASA